MSILTCSIHGLTWHISSGMCPKCRKESEAAHDEYMAALRARMEGDRISGEATLEDLFEVHVHANDCRMDNSGKCTCVPFVFDGEDERSTDAIVEANDLHHKPS